MGHFYTYLGRTPCCRFACLGGLFSGLVALGLHRRQAFGRAVRLGRRLLALLLVYFVADFGLDLHLRQFGPHLVKLTGQGLSGLLLLAKCGPGLVLGLMGPLQVGTQLAGAAFDLLGAGRGRVSLFLGGGQLLTNGGEFLGLLLGWRKLGLRGP